MTTESGLDLTSMPSETGTVLVAGDGGPLGSYAARLYHQLGWHVHGVSRRQLFDVAWKPQRRLTEHRSRDELAKTPGLTEVTHLVFGAYIERDTDAELIEMNDVPRSVVSNSRYCARRRHRLCHR